MTADRVGERIEVYIEGARVGYAQSTFPGGEVHVRLEEAPTSNGAALLVAHIRASDDLMLLLMLTDAIRRAGCDAISLRMPYLPYARQDRVCAPGEALSLRVFCDLINAQRYGQVEIWDAHSDTALALLDRVHHVRCSKLVWSAARFFDRQRTVLVAPDAGAIKKVSETAGALSVPFVRADKTRNPATGEITGTVVYSDHIGDRDFLIVDDICDGGRTFIELAKQLRPLTGGAVLLYVTHGIFSKGTAVFDGLIDRVIVANSFVDPLPDNFHVIKD